MAQVEIHIVGGDNMFRALWFLMILCAVYCYRGDVTMKVHRAAFGCGCFWGPQRTFAKLTGVTRAVVGYMGGKNESPTYRSVCQGDGHIESVLVEYDDTKISYKELLDAFWDQEVSKHLPTGLMSVNIT